MGRRQLLSGSMTSVLLLVSSPCLGTVCGRCACFTWLMSSDVKKVTLKETRCLIAYCLSSLETSARALPQPLAVPVMLKGHRYQLSLSSTGLPRQTKPIPSKTGAS